MNRFRIIGSWAWQGLLFHKIRSVLTIAAVGLSLALLTNTLGFQAGYQAALKRSIESLGYQILVTGKGCPHEAATLILRGGSIPMYIREEVYRHIAGLAEVQDSTRFFIQSVAAMDGRSAQLYMGIDENFLRLKPGVEFQRGGWFSSDGADEAILGFNVAEYRRLGLTDEIVVQGRKLAVRGVLDKLGTQDDGTIFLPLSLSQTLFEKRDRLTGIGIRLRDMSQAEAFIDRLYDIPSVQVVRMSQVQSTILAILGGVRALLMAFGSMCLVVALMGVFNVALITANERTAEMGVLRALGCSASLLFRLAWSESLLLSLCGVTVGTVLSVALRSSVEWGVRWALVFVPSGTVVSVSPLIILGSCSSIVLLCLLAGVYPAWKSSRVSPMNAIRGTA